MLNSIRDLWKNEVLVNNPDLWRGEATNHLMEYERHLYESFKHGVTDRGEKVWTFWNAVFYCGTIYTTIGKNICLKKFLNNNLQLFMSSI